MGRFDLEKLFVWKLFQQVRNLHGILSEDHRKRLYLVTDEEKYLGFGAYKNMVIYNPITYFAMLPALMLPQSAYLHHRSWMAVFLALFSLATFCSRREGGLCACSAKPPSHFEW